MTTGNCGESSPQRDAATEHSPIAGGIEEPDPTSRLDAEITFSGDDLALYPTITACPDAAFRLDLQAAAEREDSRHSLRVGRGRRPPHPSRPRGRPDRHGTLVHHTLRCGSDLPRPDGCRRRGRPPVGRPAGRLRSVLPRGHDRLDRPVAPPLPRAVARPQPAVRGSRRCCRRRLPQRPRDRRRPERDDTLVRTVQLPVAAKRLGYFEVPRRASQRELAERFDVTPSAISQQLRSAIDGLIGWTLSVE